MNCMHNILDYAEHSLKASHMSHFVMVTIYCGSLSTNTRFRFHYKQLLSAYDVIARKELPGDSGEAIKL